MSDTIQEYAAGETIFEQGDDGGHLYVIERGSIEIYRTVDQWRHLVAVLTHGDFFGEMAIVHQRPRSATAVAREDCRLVLIPEATLTEMLGNKVEIAVRIIQTLAARLEQANRKLELLLLFSESKRKSVPRPSAPESGESSDGESLFDEEASKQKPDGLPIEAYSGPISVADMEFDELWSNVSEVIIDKDYDTALEYLQQAEKLRPDDPRIPKYKRKLAALIEMADESFG